MQIDTIAGLSESAHAAVAVSPVREPTFPQATIETVETWLRIALRKSSGAIARSKLVGYDIRSSRKNRIYCSKELGEHVFVERLQFA
jgi:hypothetical protein